MASNREILGHAAEEVKTVNVQKADGSFVRMSLSEANAFQEKEAKIDALAVALRNFNFRKQREEEMMNRLSLGGSDPRGMETLVKIIGRRSTR